MKTRKTLYTVLFSLSLLALGVAISASAHSVEPEEVSTDDILIMDQRASLQEQRDTEAMWTLEEIANAPAMPLPEYIASNDRSIDEENIGEAGNSEGAQPHSNANLVAAREFPESWNDLMEDMPLDDEMENGSFGTAGVYTGYYANAYSAMYTSFPFKTIGKLTFRTSPTSNSSCTATVISTRVIVTAAHCVYDTNSNRWYSNFAFTPAWRNGSAPYGTFSWTHARILSGWANASGTVRRYDVAIIRLNNNSAGRPPSYYTGYLGRSWNYGYTQHLHAFGYPSNISSGRYSYACAAESFRGSTDVRGMGCNMTYGSSGGPWLRVHAPFSGSGSRNLVTGVVSGGTPGTNTFYGPRFSSNNIVPLCAISGGWGC